MIKCHYCEYSQMSRGEIHCPRDECVMPKAEIEKLNGLHKPKDDTKRIKAESMLLAVREYKKNLIRQAIDNMSGEVDIDVINDCASDLIGRIAEMVGETE